MECGVYQARGWERFFFEVRVFLVGSGCQSQDRCCFLLTFSALHNKQQSEQRLCPVLLLDGARLLAYAGLSNSIVRCMVAFIKSGSLSSGGLACDSDAQAAVHPETRLSGFSRRNWELPSLCQVVRTESWNSRDGSILGRTWSFR